jgi:hypothetical protein
MSYGLGITIVVLVPEQNVILQPALFTAGMLRAHHERSHGRRAAEQGPTAPSKCEQCNHTHTGRQRYECYRIILQPMQPLLHYALLLRAPTKQLLQVVLGSAVVKCTGTRRQAPSFFWRMNRFRTKPAMVHVAIAVALIGAAVTLGRSSHDDRDALRCALRGADRGGAADYDDINLRPQQIADQRVLTCASNTDGLMLMSHPHEPQGY